MQSYFEDLIIFKDWMGSAGWAELKAEGEAGDIKLEILSTSLFLFSLP